MLFKSRKRETNMDASTKLLQTTSTTPFKTCFELQTTGGLHTWSNGRGCQHTKSRLDMAFRNLRWITRWRQMCPHLLFGNTSDHAVIQIDLINVESGCKPFCGFNSWIRILTFNEIFRKAWLTRVEGTPLYWLQQKIRITKFAIKDWANLQEGPTQASNRITAAMQELASMITSDPNNPMLQQEYACLKEISHHRPQRLSTHLMGRGGI